jgi:hypothetical protein
MTSEGPQAGICHGRRVTLALRERSRPRRSSAISSENPCIGRRAPNQIGQTGHCATAVRRHEKQGARESFQCYVPGARSTDH